MRRLLRLVALVLVLAAPLACGENTPTPNTEPDAGSETPDASTPVTGPFALLGLAPEDGASAVALDSTIRATFSQPVDLDSVQSRSFRVYPSASGPGALLLGTFGASDDGRTITFTPREALRAGTEYAVVVKSGTAGILATDGDALLADTTALFTTSGPTHSDDEIAPTVESITPADGAQDVPLDTKITLRFSEKIDPASLNDGSFEFIEWWDGNPQSAPLGGTFDLSANPTVVFTPAVPLGKGDEYKVTVRTGVKDLAGNALEKEATAIFDAAWITPDESASVVSTTPAANATGVFTNAAIQVVFSKRMAQASVTSPTTVKLYKSGQSSSPLTLQRQYHNNPTFMFYPQGSLAANTSYTLEILGGANGVKDDGQNPMPQTFTMHFTTGAGADTSPLTVTSLSPASGATNASYTTPITITFDKQIDPASLFLSYPGTTGTLLVSKYADYSSPLAGTLDFSANPEVRFTLAEGTTYELERTYYVKIAGGTNGVKAISGSKLAANVTSTFTTQGPDNPDGTIADLRAANGPCAIRVKGVYMTFFRDQPNTHKGFFIQKEKSGPAIFVDTGGYKPLFAIPPESNATLYPNIDITVTNVGDFNGFKQVQAFSMTRNSAAGVDLTWVKDNLVQVIGDVPLGADHESEYVQIDGVLQNYKPGASAENREYDLVYGTNKKVKLKISQFGLRDPMGLGLGSRVRVLAPLQRDKDGFFLKPYKAWDATARTAAELDQPANYEKLRDIAKLAP